MFGLTHNQKIVISESVLWHLQVVWSRALPDTARDVIVAAMAGAEPATIVSSIGQRNTAQVGAHTNHHQPLRGNTTNIHLWL